jgi:hypothetical protein
MSSRWVGGSWIEAEACIPYGPVAGPVVQQQFERGRLLDCNPGYLIPELSRLPFGGVW